jgi:hypothetical protein
MLSLTYNPTIFCPGLLYSGENRLSICSQGAPKKHVRLAFRSLGDRVFAAIVQGEEILSNGVDEAISVMPPRNRATGHALWAARQGHRWHRGTRSHGATRCGALYAAPEALARQSRLEGHGRPAFREPAPLVCRVRLAPRTPRLDGLGAVHLWRIALQERRETLATPGVCWQTRLGLGMAGLQRIRKRPTPPSPLRSGASRDLVSILPVLMPLGALGSFGRVAEWLRNAPGGGGRNTPWGIGLFRT